MAEIVLQIQNKIEDETKELQNQQRDMQKLIDGRQRLIEQQHENVLVKKEFDLLEPNTKVTKLIGSVLVAQTLVESKDNVNKRIDFITKELKRVDDLVKENTNKQALKRQQIQKMQEQLYQIVQQFQAQQQKQQQ